MTQKFALLEYLKSRLSLVVVLLTCMRTSLSVPNLVVVHKRSENCSHAFLCVSCHGTMHVGIMEPYYNTKIGEEYCRFGKSIICMAFLPIC